MSEDLNSKLQRQAAIRRAANQQQRISNIKKQNTASPHALSSGFEADIGRDRITLSDGSIYYADTNTNGVRGTSDAIVVHQGLGTVSVDAPPAFKKRYTTKKQVVPTAVYPFKILFSVVEDGMQKFYVGGDRTTPSLILQLPIGSTSNYNAAITNSGKNKNDWIIGISYYDSSRNEAVVKNIYGADLTNTSKNWEKRFPDSYYPPYVWRQWGLWTGNYGAPESFPVDSGFNLSSRQTLVNDIKDAGDGSTIDNFVGTSTTIYLGSATSNDSPSTELKNSLYQFLHPNNYIFNIDNIAALQSNIIEDFVTQAWVSKRYSTGQDYPYHYSDRWEGKGWWEGNTYGGKLTTIVYQDPAKLSFYPSNRNNYASGSINQITETASFSTNPFENNGRADFSIKNADLTCSTKYLYQYESLSGELVGAMNYSSRLVKGFRHQSNVQTQSYTNDNQIGEYLGKTFILPDIHEDARNARGTSRYNYTKTIFNDPDPSITSRELLSIDETTVRECLTSLTTISLNYALVTEHQISSSYKTYENFPGTNEAKEIDINTHWIYNKVGEKSQIVELESGSSNPFSPVSETDTLIKSKDETLEVFRLPFQEVEKLLLQDAKVTPLHWILQKNGTQYNLIQDSQPRAIRLKSLKLSNEDIYRLHGSSLFSY